MTPPAVKVNPRIQGIRDRTGLGIPNEPEPVPLVAEVKTEVPTDNPYGVAEKTLRMTLAVIRFRGLNESKAIAECIGKGKSTIAGACKVLEDMGCIIGSNTRPKTYTYAKTPEGWVLEDVIPMPRESESKNRNDPANNVLTHLLAKKNPRVLRNSIAQYEQFIRDTSGDYGGELAELVDCLHEFCKSRILLATEECPLCGRMLGREGTRVFCRQCKRSIDLEDSGKSLDAYLRLAELDMGAKQ